MSKSGLDWHDADTCNHCGLDRTAEGHDGCLGTLQDNASSVPRHNAPKKRKRRIRKKIIARGPMNVCCGHGGRAEGAYIQYRDGTRLGEAEALAEFKRLGVGPNMETRHE